MILRRALTICETFMNSRMETAISINRLQPGFSALCLRGGV